MRRSSVKAEMPDEQFAVTLHRRRPTEEDILPTVAEREAIRAIALYGTMRAAAVSLSLSQHTVDAHIDRLRAKSGLRYLPQLVAWAGSQGWLLAADDGEIWPYSETG